MPSGGLDLAPPPVRVWASLARAQQAVLLRGCNLYSQGAGGFDQVPALPAMVRIKQPANPNSEASVRAAQIYTQKPAHIKQRLEARFGGSA